MFTADADEDEHHRGWSSVHGDWASYAIYARYTAYTAFAAYAAYAAFAVYAKMTSAGRWGFGISPLAL